MSDNIENNRLLERLIIPKQYASMAILKVWFLEGAHDAMEGRMASNEFEMTRRVGAPATEAYQAGYKTVRQLKNMAG